MFNWFKRKLDSKVIPAEHREKEKKLDSKVEFTPIPAEHKEKAWEYQQVAGLLCQDIDLLVDMCDDEKITKEEMLWFVKDLQKTKDLIITDKKTRDSRYAAAAFLASIPKGCIVSTPME